MVREVPYVQVHPDEPSFMPYAYFCESCGEEIGQHKGVAVNHERACFRRRR